MIFLDLRIPGYALLSGCGAEIGGFEHPAKLPNADRVIRCDRITKAEAIRMFPEIDPDILPEVDLIFDIDADGLKPFADSSLDFVVCCHVLEHLKNPIKALSEIFRTLRLGGRAAIAVPDKRFTFDRDKPLTPWDKLQAIYLKGTKDPSPEDYTDILTYQHPQMLQLPAIEKEKLLRHFLYRREHLNIWNSATFSTFLVNSGALLRLHMTVRYESNGEQTQLEHFVVLEKTVN